MFFFFCRFAVFRTLESMLPASFRNFFLFLWGVPAIASFLSFLISSSLPLFPRWRLLVHSFLLVYGTSSSLFFSLFHLKCLFNSSRTLFGASSLVTFSVHLIFCILLLHDISKVFRYLLPNLQSHTIKAIVYIKWNFINFLFKSSKFPVVILFLNVVYEAVILALISFADRSSVTRLPEFLQSWSLSNCFWPIMIIDKQYILDIPIPFHFSALISCRTLFQRRLPYLSCSAIVCLNTC